jgi:hypothetical protein
MRLRPRPGCQQSVFETARLARLIRMTTSKIHAPSGEDAELEAARSAGDKHRALTLLNLRHPLEGGFMTRIAPVGLLLAAVSACMTTMNGGDGIGSGSESGTGSAISPRAGAWISGKSTVVSNTCATQPQDDDGAFSSMIEQVAPTSFRVVPDDGTAPFTCTTSDAQYSCPNVASLAMDYHPSFDAVLTIHAAATVTLTDSSHGSVRLETTLDCSGMQCGMFGSLPCSTTFEVPIQAQ